MRSFPYFSYGSRTRHGLVVFAAVVILAMVFRMFFGVDFRDESYYVAMVYRFVLGDVPFVDDRSFHQGPAILSYPFARMWFAAFGNSGIVLMCRALFLALWAGVSWIWYRSLRDTVGNQAAGLAALVWFTWIPFYLPGIGYNGFGMAFFATSMLLAFAGRSAVSLAGSGAAIALAAVSYPTFAVLAPLPALAAAFAAWRARSFRPFLFWFLGAAIVTAIFLGIYHRELASFAASLRAKSVVSPHLRALNFHRFATVAGELRKVHPPFWLLGTTLWLLVAGRKSRWAAFAGIFLPLVAYRWISDEIEPGRSALMRVISLNYFWVWLFVVGYDDKIVRRGFIFGFVPAAFAGIAIAGTSLNGYSNAGIGLSFSVVWWVACGTHFLRERFGVDIIWPLVPALFLVVAQISDQARFAYGEDVPYRDQARVGAGPFAGLFTSEAKRDELRAWGDDFAKVRRELGPRCESLLSVTGFPPAYLFTDCRPALTLAWSAPVGYLASTLADRERFLAEYSGRERLPGIVVVAADLPLTVGDPFFALVRGLETRGFSVLGQGHRIYFRR